MGRKDTAAATLPSPYLWKSHEAYKKKRSCWSSEFGQKVATGDINLTRNVPKNELAAATSPLRPGSCLIVVLGMFFLELHCTPTPIVGARWNSFLGGEKVSIQTGPDRERKKKGKTWSRLPR